MKERERREGMRGEGKKAMAWRDRNEGMRGKGRKGVNGRRGIKGEGR